jgi:hypothetical protein
MPVGMCEWMGADGNSKGRHVKVCDSWMSRRGRILADSEGWGSVMKGVQRVACVSTRSANARSSSLRYVPRHLRARMKEKEKKKKNTHHPKDPPPRHPLHPVAHQHPTTY